MVQSGKSSSEMPFLGSGIGNRTHESFNTFTTKCQLSTPLFLAMSVEHETFCQHLVDSLLAENGQ